MWLWSVVYSLYWGWSSSSKCESVGWLAFFSKDFMSLLMGLVISRIISKLIPLTTELTVRSKSVSECVYLGWPEDEVGFACKAFVTTRSNLIAKERFSYNRDIFWWLFLHQLFWKLDSGELFLSPGLATLSLYLFRCCLCICFNEVRAAELNLWLLDCIKIIGRRRTKLS